MFLCVVCLWMLLRAAKSTMQIFNLEISKKIKSHKMPDDEPIQFWTWINNTTVGVVTIKSAYHWSVEGETAPRQVCVLCHCGERSHHELDR